MQIDAHLHLWRFRPGELPPELEAHEALCGDFLPRDLEPELDLHGLDGCVAVQAVPGRNETRWLLEQCAHFPFVRGVVGWLDLLDAGLEAALDLFTAHPCFRGLRLSLSEKRDAALFESEALTIASALLSRRRLTCDLSAPSSHLAPAAAFAARHPALSLVLDRLAPPRSSRPEALRDWARELGRLAPRPNASCKIAGLVGGADWERWTPEELRPPLEIALELFGPERLLFGSDWPVCRLAANYAAVVQLALDFAGELSPTERARFLGGNAARFYHLPS